MTAASYRGARLVRGGRPFVTVISADKPRGRPLPWRGTLRLANHSPDGPEWGYAGSGPAQLALAILYHYAVHVVGMQEPAAGEWAVRHHQQFKRDFVQAWPETRWSLESTEIDCWRAALAADDPAGAT